MCYSPAKRKGFIPMTLKSTYFFVSNNQITRNHEQRNKKDAIINSNVYFIKQKMSFKIAILHCLTYFFKLITSLRRPGILPFLILALNQCNKFL